MMCNHELEIHEHRASSIMNSECELLKCDFHAKSNFFVPKSIFFGRCDFQTAKANHSYAYLGFLSLSFCVYKNDEKNVW